MILKGRSPLTGGGVEVEVSGDRVVRATPVDLSDDAPFVSQGFIDLQVNGYHGIDYSGENLRSGDVRHIVELLVVSGTTTHVPTVITNSHERILGSLRAIAAALSAEGPIGSDADLEGSVAGIHVEGPYISENDGARGAHDAQFVRDPSLGEYEEWQEASGGRVSIMTLAPERDGALPFIERVAGDGVVVGIGHTEADAVLIGEAVAAGARLSTHLGNGSALQIHRLRNHIWPQLAEDRLTASVVADGFHLPDEVLTVITRAKGEDGLILVSDVSPIAGYAEGTYRWGTVEVEAFADGHLQLAGSEYLAGAGHLLDHCVARTARAATIPGDGGRSTRRSEKHRPGKPGDGGMGRAVKAATTNPARLLGLSDLAGGITVGARANLVLFRNRPIENRVMILKVIRNGRVVVDANGQ
ncbi:MAG: amidohydrolase family protein [Spirochaetia bacterium]